MNIKSYYKTLTLLFLFLFLNLEFSQAQTAKPPRLEKLLNGMSVLIWNMPEAPKVTIKLRIHSGSAYDMQNKEGTMAMLADSLFPNQATKEFFTEDLGGSLEVFSNYDYIQINATANNEQFLTAMETIANALINPQIDKETTAKVRAARLEKLLQLEKNPAYIIDQAVAKRLFGDFPYGRPQLGTSQSVAKIDFADLLLAKQRFLTADNATLAIVGNIKPDLAYRAARRFMGSWTQADKKTPATFRQPDAPDTKANVLSLPFAENAEIRYALRGFARNDNNFGTSSILIRIMQNRLQKQFSSNSKITVFVRQNSNFLPGLIIIGLSNLASDPDSQLQGKPPNTQMVAFKDGNLAASLLKEKISAGEFEKAKSEVLMETNQKNPVDLWLDVDTYKLGSVKDELQKFNNISMNEVQNLAEKFVKEPTVTVVAVKP